MPSPTWILFDHGQGVEVTLSLYAPPAGSNRPVDAYVITECEGAFTRAARRAAEACYGLVKQARPATTPMVVGFDLQGLQAGANITGESGGLAMAIALAKTLLDKDPGPVAATGILAAGHAGTEIAEVCGLAGKLAEAERLLPEGSWLLLPAGNIDAIDPATRTRLAARSIRVQTVANLNEALSTLFPDDFLPTSDGKPESPVDRSRGPGLALLVFLFVIIGWMLWSFSRPAEVSRTERAATGPSQPAVAPTPAEAADASVKAAPSDKLSKPDSSDRRATIVPTQAAKPAPAEEIKPAIPAGHGFD